MERLSPALSGVLATGRTGLFCSRNVISATQKWKFEFCSISICSMKIAMCGYRCGPFGSGFFPDMVSTPP